MGPFEFLGEVLTLYSAAKLVGDSLHKFQRTGVYLQAKQQLSGLGYLVRGSFAVVLIERLDDGTDPARQHLRLDMAPAFPPERASRALYLWPARSDIQLSRMIDVLWAEVGAQAASGAQPGDERTTTVTIEVSEDVGRITSTFRGVVGGQWHVVGKPEAERHWSHMLAFARRCSDLHAQVRAEAKAARRASRRSRS